ncbi:unnamed protein product [Peniophora sp. CBMAI 1063]|nr:unnamed protein product [Peniophora sp. CBMAI 1063]
MLAMDCNFRARNRDNKSKDETSPMLGDGMAYMVPEEDYQAFTKNNQHDQEMSTCSKFGAMILANLKKGRGYRTTGVGGVFCSRHGFWWPNSVGTLVKGERYCTIDFILASVARRLRSEKLHLSYDIICQYARNLEACLRDVKPDSFIYEGAQKLLNEVHKVYAVPKFHNPGHKELCQQWFNLAFQLFCGQTDGEASERAWAGLNPATTSMREMGAGTMRDTIDFYCGMWNWRKTIGLGPFLFKKLEIALAEAQDHCEIYTGLREVLADEDAGTLQSWMASVIAWENRDEEGRYDGKEAPNPYKPKTKPITLHQARLRSAQAMKTALQNVGTAAASQASEIHTATLDITNFILLGFKIELMKFRVTAERNSNTVLQKAERTERKNELLRHIAMFRKQQQWIMPLVSAGLQELQGKDVDGTGREAEDYDDGDELIASADANDPVLEATEMNLFLPSELPAQLAVQHNHDVLMEEICLRWGGLSDAVVMIRQNLQIKGVVHRFRKGNTRGQRPNTRVRGKQAVIEANLAIAKAAYRLHRERFAALANMLTAEERARHIPSDWESRFQVLEELDCVAIGSKVLIQIEEADIAHARALIAARKGDTSVTGQTHRKVSWLWYTSLDGATLELNDDMRVEFLRCRARAMRWVEEIYHLCYEMVRTPEFTMNKAEWWARKATLEMPGVDGFVRDGMRAYARKQSTMFMRQSDSLKEKFAEPLTEAAQFIKTHGLDGLIHVS